MKINRHKEFVIQDINMINIDHLLLDKKLLIVVVIQTYFLEIIKRESQEEALNLPNQIL